MIKKTIVATALSGASILTCSAPAAAHAEVGVVVGIQSDQGYYNPYDYDNGDYTYSSEEPSDRYDFDEPYASGWADVDRSDNWADEPGVDDDWQGQDDEGD